MENLARPANGLAYAYNQSLVAWQSMIQGDVAMAEKMLRNAVSITDEKHGRRSSPACAVAGYLAEILYETNALSDLEQLLAGRLDVMNQMVFFESLIRAYLAGARLRFIAGDTYAAYELLDRLKVYGITKGLKRPVAAALGERIRMELLHGNLANAQVMQQRLDEVALSYEDESTWHSLGNALDIPVTARICRARCAIAAGELPVAVQLLESFSKTPVCTMRIDIAMRVHLLRAIALAGQNKTADAAQALGDTLGLTAPTGMLRVYLDEGKACEMLLKALSARLPHPEPKANELLAHAQSILSAFESYHAQSQRITLPKPENQGQGVPEKLSEREEEVLQLLAQGMPNKRIALMMNISIDTVKWHLKNIFGKLEVTDRQQAIDKAYRTGILAPRALNKTR